MSAYIFDRDRCGELITKVRDKASKPEFVAFGFLLSSALFLRLHGRDLPGRSIPAFLRRCVADYVYGSFWHGRAASRKARLQRTWADFWPKKLPRNVARDAGEADWTSMAARACETIPAMLKRLGWTSLGAGWVSNGT